MNPKTSITINADGSVEVDTIDYDAEAGPFWYVEVDDTPISPDRPLPLEHAIKVFRREAAEAIEAAADGEDGGTVEIRQCTADDLEWAGVAPGGEASC